MHHRMTRLTGLPGPSRSVWDKRCNAPAIGDPVGWMAFFALNQRAGAQLTQLTKIGQLRFCMAYVARNCHWFTQDPE